MSEHLPNRLDMSKRDPGSFGGRLYARRASLGLNLSQVAEKAGITTVTLSYYERGITVPPVTTAARLARILGLALDGLMAGIS